MKVNTFGLIMALVIAAMIAWLFTLFTAPGDETLALSIGGFICLGSTLSANLGLTYADGRSGVNIKLIGTIFTVAFLISNIIFILTPGFSIRAYIISSVILLCLFALSVRGIMKAN